ncbi:MULTISPECIES: SIMPL domain-containing protein [unclassified Oceanobacter]|uniref:SIMPL domain-containing protein n=1 Tax=unclassified Oceanobacter TaxID=2620260 RepID=UPI002734C587|nr:MULTISPECIES: SIMPL domain-containing protein [unclassified Oceanobacter]MDP2609847.1 SIMPL domain-containing protein [Oceanobacter sp. 1_MG-2023]MDP2612275.1 SIMPL domain-containing protein [Oceanobacter sp. 2_MG-2023]
MIRLTRTALMLCLPLAAVLSQPALAGEPAYVQVSASADIQANPDYLLLNLSISDIQPTLAAAKRQVDDSFHQLMAVTRKLDIAEEHVRAEQISNYPQYQWIDKSRTYTGEQVTRRIEITLRDLGNYGDLVHQLMQNPLVQISQSQFRFDNRDALENQALQNALLKAKDKAHLMATTLNSELGDVLAISESGSRINQPVYAMREMSVSSKQSAPMLVQKQTISASVDVRFELE